MGSTEKHFKIFDLLDKLFKFYQAQGIKPTKQINY